MDMPETLKTGSARPDVAGRVRHADDQDMYGVTLGFLAFFIWGLFPIYFALLRDVPPLVTLAFRAVFTSVLLIPALLWFKRGRAVLDALRNPWHAAGLFVTMATTAASWGLFIWLVAVNHTTYASLGNYASPLVTVALAAIIFKERLTRLQTAAIITATLAVMVFAHGVGRTPWESVIVAIVFAVYSALRKMLDVDSTTALAVETLFATPVAVAYILVVALSGSERPEWSLNSTTLALLVGAGALTAVPILLFGAATHRCRLATLAILNYLTPTGQFLCGAFLLHEETSAFQWLSFVLIWIALVFFTIDLFQREGRFRSAENESDV